MSASILTGPFRHCRSYEGPLLLPNQSPSPLIPHRRFAGTCGAQRLDVDREVQCSVTGPKGNGVVQALLAALQCDAVLHRPIEPGKFQQACYQPGRWPQRQNDSRRLGAILTLGLEPMALQCLDRSASWLCGRPDGRVCLCAATATIDSDRESLKTWYQIRIAIRQTKLPMTGPFGSGQPAQSVASIGSTRPATVLRMARRSPCQSRPGSFA